MSASSGKDEHIAYHVEEARGSASPPLSGKDDYSVEVDDVAPADQKRIMRKIDLRLVPLLGSCYCISLLDRTNLSAANIAGMSKQLKLGINERYSIIALVFFITYVVLQPPATIMLRWIGPRNFLSTIIICWGLVMLGMGFAKDWTVLVALRLILGIFEAGFFPGVVYLMSTYYTRYDVGKRYAFFYTIGVFASGLGGILAYGIMQMSGIGGYLGWSWIFIIEGILTVFLGIIAFFYLVSFPDDTKHKNAIKFLEPKEAAWVMAKVNADRGDAVLEPFTLKRWLGGAADIKVWAFALLFGSATTTSYALAYFLPLILVSRMGFSVATAQCLTAPPYAFAGIMMNVVAYFSDKYHQRGLGIIFQAMLCIIGLPIMGFAHSPAVRYFGVFLATAGCNGNVPLVLTYQANNIRGQWKRAFASATIVGAGGIGGIVGSTVFRTKDAPYYKNGLYVTIGANALIIVVVMLLSVKFMRDNKKAERGELKLEGAEDGFKYTL